jgi:hypothetical protein
MQLADHRFHKKCVIEMLRVGYIFSPDIALSSEAELFKSLGKTAKLLPVYEELNCHLL